MSQLFMFAVYIDTRSNKMPGAEIGGGEGSRSGRTRRAASRAVETAQRVGRGILDRLRGRNR